MDSRLTIPDIHRVAAASQETLSARGGHSLLYQMSRIGFRRLHDPPIAKRYRVQPDKVLADYHKGLQVLADPKGENQTVRQSGPDRDHQPPRPSHLLQNGQ